ncbi:MAG: TIGR03617 family F420-dependent LLM class oxidoreductase [Microthrixaceae bacterium]
MQVLAPIYGLTDAAEEGRRLERAGVDGAFTFEGPHDVFLPLAVAAAATDLALMSNVAIAFPRNAVHLAHAAWDLQLLSGRRFTLGLGTQIRTHIERRFGEEFDHPVARMRDTVDAVRAIFATWQDGVPLDHRGPYRNHTLMSPIFSPPPTELEPPAVVVGGLGPKMCAMAAEVADGLAVMPVTSRDYFAEHTMPAVRAGLARRADTRGEFEVLPELILCVGRNAEEQAVADAGCKGLLGFYSSTPAYRPVFESVERGHIQPLARSYTREGRWDELGELIDEHVLSTVSVRGTPAEVAAQIAERYSAHTDRVAVYTPYAMADDLLVEIVDALHAV